MAGLSSYLTDKGITTETMPSWFTTAQQNLASATGQAVTPPIEQTAGQAAVNLFGQASPFASGQQMLESIGTGAANPWIVSQTGQVTPNVATPMGGLYSAQQQYLNQLLPDIEAGATAPMTAAGGFGSRMNISGAERAKAQAAADLFQKQMASALQAQQIGAQAASGLGTLGAQTAEEAIKTGTFQQAYPYANLINAANIYGKLGPTVGKTTEVSKQLSLPAQLGALSTIFGGGQQGLQGLYGNLTDFTKWAGNILGGAINEPVSPTYGGGASDPTVPGDWVY